MFFIFLAKNQSFETVAKRVPCTADEITDDDIWSPTPNGVNVDLNTVIIRDSMSPVGNGNSEHKSEENLTEITQNVEIILLNKII